MTYDLGTLASCFEFPKCRVSQDNHLSAAPVWRPVAGNAVMKWARKRETPVNVSLGTNDQDPRTFWGAIGNTSRDLGTALLCVVSEATTPTYSPVVCKVCVCHDGLKSIVSCHKKPSPRASVWGSGRSRHTTAVCRLAPSPVTDRKAWSTSQNSLAWKTHLWCYIQIHLFIIPFKVGKVIWFSILK